VFEFTPSFVKDLNEAKKNNSLVVFLVDAGTVSEPSWRERLETLDSVNSFNLGTLVLWPENGRQPGVQQELKKVFDDNYKRNYPVYFRDDIDSSDRFRTSLADLLETLRLSVVNQGPPKRDVAPSSFSPSGAL
jgi:hypothetical protein